ncbi:hypothetical protein RND71_039070 [Anisodus tanguticus]|uniref:F-box domain-containing protein n=1 Tax=Anisodus tanguticus TaxID=243964 RepID=A0AAE1UXA5_9SOLA|nr:hypothetical protein RND71_039070 [Anisodus tanguticus]
MSISFPQHLRRNFAVRTRFLLTRNLLLKPCLKISWQIRIVCGVDHDDLKRLFHVSRAFREVSMIAKGWHFDFSTPRKTLPFRNALEVEELGDTDEVEEAPNAPMQPKIARSRLSRKKLADISVALFASDS